MNRSGSSRSLRHCMIVLSYYPLDIRVRREAEALAEHGHSVDVICRVLDNEARHESIRGITVHRLAIGQKKWKLFSQFFDYLAFACLAFAKVTQLHLKQAFDVVQVHNLP